MTLYQIKIFQVGPNEALSPGDMHQTVRSVRGGGLCILPSDTCYAVAGNPMRRGVTQLIDRLLARNGMAMSVAFGSQRMMERYLSLGHHELRILDASKPSQEVTIVAPIRTDVGDGKLARTLSETLGGTPGFVGARLPFSFVERQLATELDGPITTVALYYPDGTPIKKFDDAIDLLVARLEECQMMLDIHALRHPPVISSGVSSVVEVMRRDNHSFMVVHREGSASINKLRKASVTISPRDVEEWT